MGEKTNRAVGGEIGLGVVGSFWYHALIGISLPSHCHIIATIVIDHCFDHCFVQWGRDTRLIVPQGDHQDDAVRSAII